MDKLPEMNGAASQPDNFEGRLLSAARALAYPPTPDVSAAVLRRLPVRRPSTARRTLVAVGIFAALLLAIVIAVPPVRAAVLDWIRIGAVRIFIGEPTPPSGASQTPTPTLTPTSPAVLTITPLSGVTPQLTEPPAPTPLTSVLDLSGQTTLAQAAAQAGFPIRLLAYPADLGQPDHVILQHLDTEVVFLVWMDPTRPQAVRMSLTEMASNSILFQKISPKSVQDTTVNGLPAVWIDSPYLLISHNGDFALTRLVTAGHTLVWTQGRMTYRLETNQNLADALRTAESLQ